MSETDVRKGACIVPWCHGDNLAARGYCGKHYARVREYGHPLWREAVCTQCGDRWKAPLGYRKQRCVGCRLTTCDNCGIVINMSHVSDSHSGQFCSRDCFSEYNTCIDICVGCGDEFEHQRPGSDPQYCCRECFVGNSEGWNRPREIVDIRECSYCGRDFKHCRSPTWGYCSESCRVRAHLTECEVCGDLFVAEMVWTKYCDGCRQGEYRRQARERKHLRRVRERESADSFERQEIFERDNWMCGICGERIQKSADWPDAESATLDHIVPLSRGGGHTRENVQASHWRCNRSKRDRAAGSQLRLIG